MSVVPVAPSREDPLVRGASELVGGALGAHSRRSRGWWSPARVVLLLVAAALALGWVQKEPCITHPWAQEYQYTRMCYSDVYALYYGEGLNHGQVPYRDHAVEYPVVIGGLMQAASWLGHHSGSSAQAGARFFDVTAFLLGLGGLALGWTTLQLVGARRRWDAALLAVSPVFVLHAFTNWDLAAAALVGLGLWAWARERVVLAGVLLGLGVATKLYPLLVLGVLLVLCLRAGRLRPWGRTMAAAAAAWAVVDVPVWAAYPAAFGRFYSMNSGRPADWDSLWFVAEHWFGPIDTAHPPTLLNALSGVALLAALGAVTYLALRAPVRPRVPQLVFLALVAFLLTNKVYSPQYGIWLLPFAVLARPRWGPLLAWQASEVALLVTRFGFFVGSDRPGEGLPIDLFLTTVLVRDALLGWLSVLVVRDVLNPLRDRVRREVGDPVAGPLGPAFDRPRHAALAPG